MDLLQAASSLSPLAVIGLLSYCVFLLLDQQKGQKKIAENHLHGLPEMEKSLERMERVLADINKGIVTLLARHK